MTSTDNPTNNNVIPIGRSRPVNEWTAYAWRAYSAIDDESAAARLAAGRAKLAQFPSFAAEVFSRLYEAPKTPPGLDAALDEVLGTGGPGQPGQARAARRPEDEWLRKAHSAIAELPSFQNLAHKARGDRLAAGMAALAFAEEAVRLVPPSAGHAVDLEGLRAEARAAKAWLDDLKAQKAAREAAGQQPDEDMLSALRAGQAALDKITAAGKAARAAIDAANAAGPDEAAVRAALRVAVDVAEEQVDELESACELWGGGAGYGMGSGAQGGSGKAKLELAGRVRSSAKLKELAALAGRMKGLARQKHRGKPDAQPSEITGIELGADLGRLLPSELIKLADPELEVLFDKGYVERGLGMYSLRDNTPKKQGPIVVCIDSSGSMAGPPELWAKAVALGLCEIARLENRAIEILHFSSGVGRRDFFPAGERGAAVAERLMKSMKFFSGGGTSFILPLDAALDTITGAAESADLSHADIIMITDGDAPIPASWAETFNAKRKHHGVSTFAVLIGTAAPALELVMDQVLTIADLADDQAVTDALFQI